MDKRQRRRHKRTSDPLWQLRRILIKKRAEGVKTLHVCRTMAARNATPRELAREMVAMLTGTIVDPPTPRPAWLE